MKKLGLLMLLIASSSVLFAHVPIFGHRGGVWGVQNTSGAFKEGAKYFDGLETDVKATKDGVLICCHDGSLANFYKDAARTTKWTSSETSFSSHTWAQLRTLKFYEYNTWTKKTYCDTICTFGQYLDICRENKVIALIELKWTTDYFTTATTAGMQKLMDEVEAHGMLNHCHIFSSMTNCIAWVRNNSRYDHIPISYLGMTGSGNPSYADLVTWAKKQRKADISPECYQIDNAKAATASDNPAKTNIASAHNAGIRVLAWNIGGTAMYTKYKGYGVDYMTVDSLRPKFLSDYTPRTDFLDIRPAGTSYPDEQPEKPISLDSLDCNPDGWQNKGQMCLALQKDLNTASGCNFNFVHMTADSVIEYGFAAGWENWKTAEAQNKAVSMDEFLAGYTYSATVVDPVKNFIESSSKWAWLKSYILKQTGLSSMTNTQWRANLDGFFLNSPANATYNSANYTTAGKETSFAPTWGYRFCVKGDTVPHQKEDTVTPGPGPGPTPPPSGQCNPYNWNNANDMYQALAADVIAAKAAGVNFTFCSEFGSGLRETFGAADVTGSTGIAFDIQNFDIAFFTTAPYAAKWGWLSTYIDSRCTADGKTKPADAEGYASSFMRYNLAAFFANSERTSWPASANYSSYGVGSTQYESTWGHKLVCESTEIEEVPAEMPAVRKIMKDGRMYILNNGRVYDIFGHEVSL